MMKLLFGAALAVAAVSAVPAQAAKFLTFDGQTGTFGNTNVTTSSFTDTFTFTVPSNGLAGSTISSVKVSKPTNIDFTSVTLNGAEFDITSTGMFEFRSITAPVLAGLQTIVVKGVSGKNASYSGTLAFAAVPEPATWAMLLFGFGAVGATLRSRKSSTGRRLRIA